MSQADRQRARRDMREKKVRERLRRAQRLDQLGARIAHLVQLRERTIEQLELRIAEAITEMVEGHRATIAEVVRSSGSAIDRHEVARLRALGVPGRHDGTRGVGNEPGSAGGL